MGAITRKDIDTAIAKARQSGKRVNLRDVDGSGRRDMPETGLVLIAGPTGTSRWTYAYRQRGTTADGKRHPQKWVNIGRPELMPVDEARAEVRRLKAVVAEGRNPLAEQEDAERQAAIEASRALSLSEAARRYLENRSTELRPSSLSSERMQVNRAVAELQSVAGPPLALGEVTKAMVANVVDQHRTKPATARHRHGAIHRLFAFAVERDLVEVNPAMGVKTPKPPAPRTWKPSASEVEALWHAAEEIGGTRGRFLKALMLVPLRLSEMAELSPSEVSGEAIELPGMRTKNGDAFRIPLPIDHRDIFVSDNEERVFQLARTGPFSARKAVVAQIRKTSGVSVFHFHALRKLFVSELAEHGVGDVDLVDGLLNHRQAASRGGVIAAYQQSGRWAQKCEVMSAWERLVAYAVEHGRWPRETKTPNNVVEMRL
ncbi:integrase family protein [Tropicimonas sp. IMCC6043]|uniref:tyrosine-type recombinase/integrase n=1 Tax=Tropicimonas sp. IMCC6043 TaxID=2510645 RepID=UPI0013EC2626|nr:integrase family protein [Tropicimonas sp. IMCC6043]